jgi:hypothetical protein
MLTNHNVLVIVESQAITQFLHSQWQTLSPKSFNKLHSFLNVTSDIKLNITFVDYIEKLFLIDTLTSQIIHNYFVAF